MRLIGVSIHPHASQPVPEHLEDQRIIRVNTRAEQLQHRKQSCSAVGSARLAVLALVSLVGVSFFPHPGARDVSRLVLSQLCCGAIDRCTGWPHLVISYRASEEG